MTLTQQALLRPLPIYVPTSAPTAVPLASREVAKPDTEPQARPPKTEAAGTPASNRDHDAVAEFKAQAQERFEENMRDATVPLATRVSRAKTAGYRVKYKGSPENPRQVVLSHDEGYRILIKPPRFFP